MTEIDRNSLYDAERTISALFQHPNSGSGIAYFLSEAIWRTHSQVPANWNLNLDLRGKFLRLNVGQEYCIEIRSDDILVLCMKSSMPTEIQAGNGDFVFRWHRRQKRIDTPLFGEAGQCLAKVPDSLAIILKRNPVQWLQHIAESNARFIDLSITTTRIRPVMASAHSVGAIEYLSKCVGKELPNPAFAQIAMVDNEERISRNARLLEDSRLAQLADTYPVNARKLEVPSSVYVRNPYIVELARRQANGICHDCGQAAPFINKKTGAPFLEVHHKTPLSDDGKDILENVVALCPNCHRKRHHG